MTDDCASDASSSKSLRTEAGKVLLFRILIINNEEINLVPEDPALTAEVVEVVVDSSSASAESGETVEAAADADLVLILVLVLSPLPQP